MDDRGIKDLSGIEALILFHATAEAALCLPESGMVHRPVPSVGIGNDSFCKINIG